MNIIKFRKISVFIIIFMLMFCGKSYAKQVKILLFNRQISALDFHDNSIAVFNDGNRITQNIADNIRLGSGMIILNNRIKLRSVKLFPLKQNGAIWISVANTAEIREYRGSIQIRPKNGSLEVINHVDIEDYLRSVVPNEMPPEWDFHTLAAQAIVSRSFALAYPPRHSSEGYDLCSLTHCQLYRGINNERDSTDRAVESTRSLVVSYKGKCIPAPYHSTCGGSTTDHFGDMPYKFLSVVSDKKNNKLLCSESPHLKWKAVKSAENIAQFMRSGKLKIPKNITELKVSAYDKSGRVEKIKFFGEHSKEISGADFMNGIGRIKGWDLIKSTAFTTRKSGLKTVFEGKGLGHGMGLCQWGAKGLADMGYSFNDIIRHYYPKCQLLQYK